MDRIRPSRRRSATRVRGVLVVALAATLLAACGPEDTGGAMEPNEPADPTEASPLPVEPDEGIGDGASAPSEELIGVLGGSAELEGGCAWVETGDGTRYEVQYPAGYEVRYDPLELVGPDGEVLAAEGDEVRLTGAVDAGMMSFCQVGEIFVATAVNS